MNLLEVEHLTTGYRTTRGTTRAVDDVSFSLGRGEVLGIVGESGCGKSTVVRSLTGLYDPNSACIERGSALFEGRDLLTMSRKDLCDMRGSRISMVFQNPLSALNPVYTVGSQITEILRTHTKMTRREAKRRAVELLDLVRIPAPEAQLRAWPHQLSGGMQQRVMIAIALACNPGLLIADEPTTALDVTVQAQILALIRSLRDRLEMGVILITHNMGVVASICDRMLVMYGGVVVEEGPCDRVFQHPRHPYTKGLLQSIPSVTQDVDTLSSIPGQIPAFSGLVDACRFADRCDLAEARCSEGEPALARLSDGVLCRCRRAVEADRREFAGLEVSRSWKTA